MLQPVKKTSDSPAALLSSLISATHQPRVLHPGDAQLVRLFGPMVRCSAPHRYEDQWTNARMQAFSRDASDTNALYGRTSNSTAAPDIRSPLHNLHLEERFVNAQTPLRLAVSGGDHLDHRKSSLTVFQPPETDEDADYKRALEDALAAQPRRRSEVARRATTLDDCEVRLLISMGQNVGEPMNSIMLDEYRRRGYLYNRE
ncbi:MAG: hypothetical protein KVP17_000577 [Porospora cf. gigantea B]|uniref:uncharacterized protein n=2 Tax=Porospora cf. gigantea B TaxID=2853592 RepID=UPI003571E20C|nr:MAG: hypothetical protein KVP17_000577 [Porospora cf. gigantea B]